MGIKKTIASIITMVMVMTFIPTSAMAATTGWQGSDSSGWRYYTTSSQYVKNDWMKIGGKWYYFNSDGYMESNCYRNGYWLTKTGEWDTNSSHGTWKSNSNGWWYEDNGWYPVSRWLWIDGYCYYFDSKGYMESDCYREGCYLSKSGAWDTRYRRGAWKSNSTGKWYEDNGWYPTNRWLKIDGRKFYFNEYGYCTNYEGNINGCISLDDMTAEEIVEECKRIWKTILVTTGMTMEEYRVCLGYECNRDGFNLLFYKNNQGIYIDWITSVHVRGFTEQKDGTVFRSDNPDSIVWIWMTIGMEISDYDKAKQVYDIMIKDVFRVTSDNREGSYWEARAENPQGPFTCATMNKCESGYTLTFTNIDI